MSSKILLPEGEYFLVTIVQHLRFSHLIKEIPASILNVNDLLSYLVPRTTRRHESSFIVQVTKIL